MNTYKPNEYIVYDEMACAVLLVTENETEARKKAFNHQCILKKDGAVIKDYSC